MFERDCKLDQFDFIVSMRHTNYVDESNKPTIMLIDYKINEYDELSSTDNCRRFLLRKSDLNSHFVTISINLKKLKKMNNTCFHIDHFVLSRYVLFDRLIQT